MLSLGTISPELMLLIAGCLPIPDIARLIQTSKQFHRLLETYPWQNIDFHAGWDHGRKERLLEESPISSASQSDLNEEAYSVNQVNSASSQRAKLFLAACASLKCTKASSWARCSSAVRTLHINLSERADEWAIILSFTNLTTLCVNGSWFGPTFKYWESLDEAEVREHNEAAAREEIRTADPAFPHLTHLTLTEYIPGGYARLFLDTTESLTDLHLALLAPPLDSPPDTFGDLPQGAYVFEDDLDSPLSSDHALAMPSLPVFPLNLANLTFLCRLYLCKPAERYDTDDEIMHNMQLERATLEEWASLLLAVKLTLEEIIFDLRPVVKEIWADGMETTEPVWKSHKEPGDERFMELVLKPVFFKGEEIRGEWPRLRKVRFCGVEIEDLMMDGQDGRGRKRLAERLGPDVEVEYTPGLFCFIRTANECIGEGYLL